MSGFPYHLRTNKGADRLAFIEAIRFLPQLPDGDLDKYKYFGFGGPYLEDMRLLYEFCPEIQMYSIEEEPWIYQRQQFHRPCGDKQLTITNSYSRDFIANYKSEGYKGIFWLDYVDLKYSHFEDFKTLLGKVVKGSMIKLTFRATPTDYIRDYEEIQKEIIEIFLKKFEDALPINLKDDFWKSENFRKMIQQLIQDAISKNEIEQFEEFKEEFGKILPNFYDKIPPRHTEFAEMVQNMIRNASQMAFSSSSQFSFFPISSFNYTDTDRSWILTFTGIKWPSDDFKTIKKAYRYWKFANLTWEKPKLIDIPDLSTKERLHLQCHLPDNTINGKTLQEKLGHLIDKNPVKTNIKLEQYAKFHRYFPYFLRGVP